MCLACVWSAKFEKEREVTQPTEVVKHKTGRATGHGWPA